MQFQTALLADELSHRSQGVLLLDGNTSPPTGGALSGDGDVVAVGESRLSDLR